MNQLMIMKCLVTAVFFLNCHLHMLEQRFVNATLYIGIKASPTIMTELYHLHMAAFSFNEKYGASVHIHMNRISFVQNKRAIFRKVPKLI